MKLLMVVLAFGLLTSTSHAENKPSKGKPIRSREECAALAIERGFTNKTGGTKTPFISACRHGLVK
jgi:hypothetical protein